MQALMRSATGVTPQTPARRPRKKAPRETHGAKWRRESESNRSKRICSPLPSRLAIAPKTRRIVSKAKHEMQAEKSAKRKNPHSRLRTRPVRTRAVPPGRIRGQGIGETRHRPAPTFVLPRPDLRPYTLRAPKGIPSGPERVYPLSLRPYTLLSSEGIPFSVRTVYPFGFGPYTL